MKKIFPLVILALMITSMVKMNANLRIYISEEDSSKFYEKYEENVFVILNEFGIYYTDSTDESSTILDITLKLKIFYHQNKNSKPYVKYWYPKLRSFFKFLCSEGSSRLSPTTVTWETGDEKSERSREDDEQFYEDHYAGNGVFTIENL